MAKQVKRKLNRQQKTTLRRSSRLTVEKKVLHLKKWQFPNGRWIGTTNRYVSNVTERIRRDIEPGGNLNQGQLAQYMAASILLHCIDGWSFIGRALHCHCHGDANVARHLAYYAELRGAMSLLAAEGIGVFLNRHFVLDSSDNCVLVPPGALLTHDFAWLTFEHWAELVRSSDLLMALVTPGGRPLSEWLEAFGAGLTARPVGSAWLKAWGLDLKRLAEDREARNEASYRPTQMLLSDHLGAFDATQFIREFWNACEPSSESPFTSMDRHLLRLSLERTYTALTGSLPEADRVDFENKVVQMLDALDLGAASDEWLEFLMRRSVPETSIIIEEAGGDLSREDPRHHLQVVSRATLLLRVATGAVRRLFRETAIDMSLLRFWWVPMGLRLGIWGQNEEPEQLSDLWADIEQALQDTENWTTSKGQGIDYHMWVTDLPLAISIFGECERIALWGFAT